MMFVSQSKHVAFALSVLLASVLGLYAVPAHAGTYHLIQVPGSEQTSVDGVNNLNQIVGWYFDSNGNGHAFLLSSGKYSTINYGQGNFTVANGINDSGVIVGFYQSATGGAAHGWIRHNGSFTLIDYPGAYSTFPVAINKTGEVVGYWWDGGNTYKAFKYVNHTFSAVNIPNATRSFAEGVDANGDISGSYWTPLNGGQAEHGFILHQNGSLQVVKDPQQPNATVLTGINDKLQAAGSYNVPNTSYFRGFVFSAGKFTAINYPNASSTTPQGINNTGVVVGTWYPTGAKQDIPQGFYYIP